MRIEVWPDSNLREQASVYTTLIQLLSRTKIIFAPEKIVYFKMTTCWWCFHRICWTVERGVSLGKVVVSTVELFRC